MARGRMISRSLSTSEKRARLHTTSGDLAEFCQALHPLLIAHADDFGRLPGSAFHVKHAIEPTSPRCEADFERALLCLDRVGLVQRYEVENKTYIQIAAFDRHQQGLHKRTRSDIPEPPALKSVHSLTNAGELQNLPGSSRNHQECAGDSRNTSEIPAEEKGTEEKGRERERGNGTGLSGTEQTTTRQPAAIAEGSVISATALPKTASASNPPTEQLLRLFGELHVAKVGTKAAVNGPKDAALLAKLWEERGGDEVERLIRAFFEDDDAWVRERGYTVGVFYSQIGRLVGHLTSTPAVRRGGSVPDAAATRELLGRGGES